MPATPMKSEPLLDLEELLDRYEDPVGFLDNLHMQLKLHGISQNKLSFEAEMSPTQVSRYFNHRVHPTVESMMRLEVAFHNLAYGQKS